MRSDSNVTAQQRVTAAVGLGALGVVAFSFSLPATRLAVADLDPWLVAFGRATVAAVLAAGYLVIVRAPRPTRQQCRRLLVVAAGIVVGFPLFTSLALVTASSAHGAVVIACLPMATAVFAVLRAGERPTAQFWLAAAAGLIAVVVFIGASGGLSADIGGADLYLLAAVVTAAAGYAEGGALARELGGAVTISWALLLATPVTVPVTVLTAGGAAGSVGWTAWFGFGYVAVVSMFLGFFAWYAGLARGGVARVGQVQLAQPILTLAWSALFLGEAVGPLAVTAALVVLTCVVWTQRTRARRHDRRQGG